ncbi:MAG: TolC family protein [Lentisphaerota bacterium]
MNHKLARFALLLIILSAGVAGCRTLQAPPKTGEEWRPNRTQTQTVTNDAVWKTVRAQSPDFSAPLTLAELVGLALRNNPNLQQAWQSARQAEAKILQADSKYYPAANISATATRLKTDSQQPEGDTLEDTQYGPKLNLTWLLLDLGGRSANAESARQTLISLNYDYNKAIQDLLLGVETAYYGLSSAQSVVEAAQADLDNAQKNFDAAQQKLQSGLSTRLDVLQAQSDLDNARYSLEVAKGGVQTARGSLAQVAGLAADTSFEIVLTTNLPLVSITKDDLGALIESALDQRPDIASLRASVKAQELAAKAAQSGLWPTLSLGASADTLSHNYSGSEQAAQLRNNEYTYSGYASLSWDFFDGFYQRGVFRSAQAQAEAEKARLKAAEIAASADVWTNYFALLTAMQKLTFGQAFLDSAQASYDLSLESYNAGLGNILDLLKAQSSLSDARSKLISARTGTYVALASLAHALGTLNTAQFPAGINP